MSNVTRILSEIESGDSAASEQLLRLVYTELRQLASAKLASERPGQTLQPTALVHEAFLRLFDAEGEMPQHWNSRGHFFAAAAEAMRRILVENARRKARVRHGGQWQKVSVSDIPEIDDDDRLVELDEALKRLATEDPQASRVVELHHFGGLSHEIVAETLQLTVYQARRKWEYARAWLQHALVD